MTTGYKQTDIRRRDVWEMHPTRKEYKLSASAAFRFVLTLGMVNLFADMTYEGAAASTARFSERLEPALRPSASSRVLANSSATACAQSPDTSATKRENTGRSPFLATASIYWPSLQWRWQAIGRSRPV